MVEPRDEREHAGCGLAPGTVLGGWFLEALLGRGGAGIVFRARQERSGIRGALKVLTGPLAAGREAMPRFRREVLALARLQHPRIVKILQESLDHEPPFFVMELLEGGTLAERIRRDRGEADLEGVLRMALDLAEGLAAIHAEKVLHRDLKPQNILFDADGRATLTDFGLAKILDATHLTAPATLIGTLAYMAPEVLAGGACDERSDLYQLGATLFEAATGRLPYDSTQILLAARRGGLPPPPTIDSFRPGTGTRAPWLEPVLVKLLASRPDGRFSSAAQLAEKLQSLRESRDIRETVVLGRSPGSGSRRPLPNPSAKLPPTEALTEEVALPVRRSWGRLATAAAALFALGFALPFALDHLRNGAAVTRTTPLAPHRSILAKVPNPRRLPRAPRLTQLTVASDRAHFWLDGPAPPGMQLTATSTSGHARFSWTVPPGASDLLVTGLARGTEYAGDVSCGGDRQRLGFRTLADSRTPGVTVLDSHGVLAQDLLLAVHGSRLAIAWRGRTTPPPGAAVYACYSLDGGGTWSPVEKACIAAGDVVSLGLAAVGTGLQLAWRTRAGPRGPGLLCLRFHDWASGRWGPVQAIPTRSLQEGIALAPAGKTDVDLVTFAGDTPGSAEQLVHLRFTAGQPVSQLPRVVGPAPLGVSSELRLTHAADRLHLLLQTRDRDRSDHPLLAFSFSVRQTAGLPPSLVSKIDRTEESARAFSNPLSVGDEVMVACSSGNGVRLQRGRPGGSTWEATSLPVEGGFLFLPALATDGAAFYVGCLSSDRPLLTSPTLGVFRSDDGHTWRPWANRPIPGFQPLGLQLGVTGHILLAAVADPMGRVFILRINI